MHSNCLPSIVIDINNVLFLEFDNLFLYAPFQLHPPLNFTHPSADLNGY